MTEKVLCPKCNSDWINKHGYRLVDDSKVCRYKCMSCGCVFQEKYKEKKEEKGKKEKKEKKLEIAVCKNCGKEFVKKVGRKRVFCSRECAKVGAIQNLAKGWKSRKRYEEKCVCKVCGREFIKRRKDYKGVCCSKDCARILHIQRLKARRKHENIRGTSAICEFCGKVFVRKRDFQRFCSCSCANKYHYTKGIKKPEEITKKAHEKARELVKLGLHPFQREDVRMKAMKNLGRRNYGKTWIEEKVGWLLKQKGLKFESQFPIAYGVDILGRRKYYFVDFALPDYGIVIECDGEFWHREKRERDVRRQAFIESLGWKVVRLKESDIRNNLELCSRMIDDALCKKFEVVSNDGGSNSC